MADQKTHDRVERGNGGDDMNRGQRRRMEREIKRAHQPGVGLGWRLTTNGRRRYPVREHRQPVDIEQLERDSQLAIRRMGIEVHE